MGKGREKWVRAGCKEGWWIKDNRRKKGKGERKG